METSTSTAEVTATALSVFRPLVFSLTSSTPDNINVLTVAHQLAAALPGNFFVLDAADVQKDAQQKPSGKKPRTATRTDASGESLLDGAKTVSERLRELYVQVAVSLEQGRRDTLDAQQAALHALQSQYVEDGMSDADALAAASAELADEDDEDTEGADDDDAPPAARLGFPFAAVDRTSPPMMVCLVNYPNSLEDIDALSTANVALQALVDIRSPAPFGATRRPSVSATAAAEKRATTRASHIKANPAAEAGTSECLAQALVEYQLATNQRPPDALGARSQVLVHTVHVPCETVSGEPDGRLRATVSEKGFLATLVDSLLDVEAKWHSFRVWSASAGQVTVPRYTPLTNPNAVPDLADLEVEEGAKRKTSTKKGTITTSGSGDEDTMAPPPQTTAPHPTSMRDVAAARTEFDRDLHAHSGHSGPLAARFAHACVRQAASSNGTAPLPTKDQRDAARVSADKSAADHFLANVLQPINGGGDYDRADDVSKRFHSPTLVDALSTASGRRDTDSECTVPNLPACLSHLISKLKVSPHSHGGPDTQALVSDMLRCGVMPLSGPDSDGVLAALSSSNGQGWRVARGEFGSTTVFALVRGAQPTCTRHGTYSFTGETSFPEYAQLIDSWLRERDVFYPPPPTSDADDAGDETETESDEEESFTEDEEGNLVRRPPREATPPPPQDHARLVAQALRRRRIFEEVSHFVWKPHGQSLLALGEGSLTVGEEVDHVFWSDCFLEVVRQVGNTRAVSATVTTLDGAQFGFLCGDPVHEAEVDASAPPTGDDVAAATAAETAVPAHVHGGVRAFAHFGESLRLQTEVLADNTAAAETAAYELAVEHAKKLARAQFDAAAAKSKSLKGKEKHSVQLQTLEELEQAYCGSIPQPTRCQKALPELRVYARLSRAVLEFDETRAAIRMHVIDKPPQCSYALNVLAPDASMNPCTARAVTLRGLRLVTYYAKGIVELRHHSDPDLLVAVHPDGSYVTCRSDSVGRLTCVTVTTQGVCTVRSASSVQVLPSLVCSPLVDDDGSVTGFVRSDQLRCSDKPAGGPAKIALGDSFSIVRRFDGTVEWHLAGLPAVVSTASEPTLTVVQDENVLCYDVGGAALTACSTEGNAMTARVDLVDYRLQVRVGEVPETPSATPPPPSTVVSIDAVFGGMACCRVPSDKSTTGGTTRATETTVCRVSPFGVCTEENGEDGRLRLPAVDRVDETQLVPVTRREVVRPAFVRALHATDLRYPRDALHWQRPLHAELSEVAAALHKWSTDKNRSRVASESPVPAAARKHYKASLLEALHIDTDAVYRSRQALSPSAPVHACAVVVGPDGEKLVFFNGVCRAVLVHRWSSRLSPLTLPPIVVPGSRALAGRTSQQALALNANDKRSSTTEPSWRLLVQTPEEQSRLTAPYVASIVSVTPSAKADLIAYCTNAAATRAPYCVEEAAGAVPDCAVPYSRPTVPASTPHMTTAVPVVHASQPLSLHFWDSNSAVVIEAEAKRPGGPIQRRVGAGSKPSRSRGDATVHGDQSSSDSGSAESVDTAPSARAAFGGSTYASKAADSYGGNPLMRTKLTASVSVPSAAVLHGGTASSRGHHPALSITPSEVEFGNITSQRVYATAFYVTNTSTVPCRYRVTPSSDHKEHIALHYPHRFLAGGMTDRVDVTLSGYQSLGELTASLTITHEGGSTSVVVRAHTLEELAGGPSTLAPAVYCLGESVPRFSPGTTRRVAAGGSDQDNTEALDRDDMSSSGEETLVLTS